MIFSALNDIIAKERKDESMNEVLYEESAQPKNLKAQKTFYVIYSVLGWLAAAAAVFFLIFSLGNLYALPLIALLAISSFLFFFFRTKIYYCIDCIFVSGSTRIIKVINYKRRKRILVFEAKEVEQVGKIGSETFEKWYSSPGVKKIYATPNKYLENGYYVVAIVNGVRYLVMFECKEEYLVNLVNFTGKSVIEKDYK